MTAYYVLTVVVSIVQLIVLHLATRNFFYVLRKYRLRPTTYTPRTALIAPCKGIDTAFERNVSALFELDYPDYEIIFVLINRGPSNFHPFSLPDSPPLPPP